MAERTRPLSGAGVLYGSLEALLPFLAEVDGQIADDDAPKHQ